MRIGLVGFFGWGNFGDELFYELWHDVISGHELVRMNDLIQKPYFEESAIKNADSVDVILIGGGDLIRVENLSDLYWNDAWTRKPVIITGIGVARESERVSGRVIPQLEKFFSSNNVLSISARDTESAKWIVDNLSPTVPVRTIPDLAFLSNTICKYEHTLLQKNKPEVALVLNKTEITDEDLRWWQYLKDAQDQSQIDARILVLGMGDQKEREMENLQSKNLAKYAVEFISVDEMVKAISQLDLIISAKFHALVVAANYNIPYISIRETSKSVAFEKYKWSTSPSKELDFLFKNFKKQDYFIKNELSPSATDLRMQVKNEVENILNLLKEIENRYK